MSFDITLTDRSLADLDRLADSLALNAGSRLETFPESCGIAYEKRFFLLGIRHLLFHLRGDQSYRA